MKDTGNILKDIGGKIIARWYTDRDGGRWVYEPQENSQLEFLHSALIIALPPKEKEITK